MLESYAQFCNKDGITILGTDSLIPIDGRWNQRSIDNQARELRERYRKYFPEKYDSMSHYTYKGVIRVVDCH